MHTSVLLEESISALQVKRGKWYVDGTFGRGGHTKRIIDQGGKVIAFDMDPDAIKYAESEMASQIKQEKLRLVHSNFANLSRELFDLGIKQHSLSGALFDLGMSSNQLEESGRGFSFQKDEPLDMRMSVELGVTAADLVNALPEKHLKNLIWENSQDSFSSAIARAIVEARAKEPIRTTKQLADLTTKAKRGRQGSRLHPATKVFQALRIAVNMELDNLTVLLDQIRNWMSPGARLVIISFHEGEDRIVKQRLKCWEEMGRGLQITKKPIVPEEKETTSNPRARSAKLRIFEAV